MRTLLAFTIAAVMALPIGAQKKPDYSGTWVIDQAATTAAGGTAPSGGANVMRGAGSSAGGIIIKHAGDTLTIQPMGGSRVTYTYKLDGVEHDAATGRIALKAKSKWDGDRIVVEQTRPGADGTIFTTTTTYSLDKDGNLHSETSTPMGPRKIVYKKKPADTPKVN
jgi:hypothetical protein